METIEITSGTNSNNAKWQPYQGEEIENLIRHKGFVNTFGTINEIGEKIIDDTFRIMEMCGDPKISQNNETGLVLGYVQSGKTLSFTSLTALANDNGYQIIIIIAGTSKPLSEQSYERMRKDLRDGDRNDRKWTIIKNAGTVDDRDTIEIKLEQWKDETFPKEDCSTILLTVMKNGNRLKNLTKILKSVDLEGVPTLIIDDESDQASLNTKASANSTEGKPVNEGEASVIYSRIQELRGVFTHHTFLQYTATPQANLFINILDRLSPNFIKLLKPGADYTGGQSFFINNPNLIRPIPSRQIPTAQSPLNEPPETLLLALKIFYLGVVAGEIKKDQSNRSMMVHPSRLTDSQNTYCNWIKNICESWKRLFQSTDEDEKSILVSEFHIAYEDLKLTVGDDLPSFTDLTGNRLIHAIKNTRIVELNARNKSTPTVKWNNFYSHILVGGQAMDRGFTVEGLTITYMPRNMGTGQVDTTLQRARFFGYKGKYLGYCRVWLDEPTILAYGQIIKHEEDVRNRLEEYDINNRHLNEWERETVLNQMLKLTRPNVIYNELNRDYFGREWFIVKAPHDSQNLIFHNKTIISDFLHEHETEFKVDAGSESRTVEQKHLVAEFPLELCIVTLLNKLKFTRESDSQTFSSLRGLITNYLITHTDEKCKIFVISSAKEKNKIVQNIRVRRLDKKGHEIQQLFQGKNPSSGTVVYPGDREIREKEQVTVQIHRLHIKDAIGEDIINEEGQIIDNDVFSIAIWLPESIGSDIIRQVDNA